MKKFFTLFLTLMTSVMLWAYDFKSGNLYYNITSNVAPYTVEVTYQKSWYYSGDITIPSSVTYNDITYAVTSIGSSAFHGCSSLTSVTIPNSVTSIGSGAIYNCSSLTSVTIPNSVKSIGDDAFSGCSSLTSVTIPNSVTSIGERAFERCASLTSVTIPNSVKSIGDYAFRDCFSLTSVTIPSSVTSIGSNAFKYCVLSKSKFINNSACTSDNNWGATLADKEQDGLLIKDNVVVGCKKDITTVTIPNGIVGIGDYAFRGCSSLTSVTIPNSVTSIGAYTFRDCSSLTSVTIPNSVTSIGERAFERCFSLTSVTIPNSVTSIGGWAFQGCSSLTSVTIPNSVTSIGIFAFDGCSSLTSVTIPNSVTSIKNHAFKDCSSLTSVTIPNSVTSIGTNAFYNTGIFNDNSNWENGMLYISNCLVAAKESLLGTYTIKDGTRIIGDRAFYNCSSLTSVTIPNSVTSIGGWAFQGCSSLTSITIPNSVTSIGNDAFRDTGIFNDNSNWENGVLYISNCLVNAKESLSGAYTIKNGTRIIGDRAFGYRSSLTSVTIPNSVTSIGSNAFGYCSSLTSVTIPSSVTSIGSNAFLNCSSLTSVTIPSSVTSIGSGAFYNCSSLTSVTIPNSVKIIGNSAFNGCSSLNTIYVGATNPPALGNSTFAGTPSPVCHIPCGMKAAYEASDWAQYVSEFVEEPCEEYTLTYTSTDGNIVTPNRIDAFDANIVSNTYENGVGTITFDGPITSIGSNAFFQCSSLFSITIPNSVTSIGSSAFSECSSLTSIIIPNSVTSIGSQAFMACPNIVSMVVENGNPIYDSRENCNAIIETATNTLVEGCQNTIIPKSVTKIGDYAFSRCTSLKSIFIHEDITSIYCGSFAGTSSVTSIIVDENNQVYDSRNNCNAIIETSSNTLIRGCENTIIPNDVLELGTYSFYGCTGLISLTIPYNVTTIRSQSFFQCINLKTMYLEQKTPIEVYPVIFQDVPSFICHIPCGTKAAYEASAWASEVSEFVEEPCEEYTITYTSTDGNIVIPNKADAFGANIVSNTYENGVGTITFDSPITSIGSNAFSECSSLTSIIIPNSVTSIGSQAFMACPNIVSMVVENGNPIYDSRENCNAIIETATNTLVEGCQNTIIPKSVTKIGDYAFSRCTSLKSIFIHEDITSIDNTSFAITSSVTSIIVDENNNIYDSRNNCNAIIETSSNTLIRGCENTIIPNDIIKLAPYSLSGIIRESLTIPKNVNNIGGQALLRTNIGKIFLNSYTPIPLGYSMEVFPFTCHIPCGTKAAYEASAWANYVSEFVEDCDNGSYSRNVRIGYNTICLPHGSSNFTGATFYEIAHILKNKKKIFFDEVKTLEAGKPYIFYPHSNEVTIYYDNTTSAVPLSHNGLHGTFDGITAASNFLKGKYLVAGNRMVLCGDGCSLAANRAYIVLDEISDKDHPAIPGIKRVSMDYSEENATTALDNITDESIVAPIQEGVYDILGRKVDAPTVSGFYIINGKKVFVAL